MSRFSSGLLLIAGVLLSAACATSIPRVTPLRYTRDSAQALASPVSDDPIFGAFGAPILATSSIPYGCEEVRISTGHGMARGLPYPALRLVRCDHTVSGEGASFRTTYDAPCPWPPFHAYCVGRTAFITKPDWAGLWHTLDSLDVWSLPSFDDAMRQYHDEMMVVDASNLHLEWRKGAAYRRWDYNAPDERRWPEAHTAAAVLLAFRRMVRTFAYTPTNLIRQYPP